MGLWTLDIRRENVRLSHRFRATIANEDGGTVAFRFDPPVQLPYMTLTLVEYRKAVDKHYLHDLSVRYQDLADLTHSVLQAGLPEFTGTNGFYQARFETGDLYGFQIGENGGLLLTHVADSEPRAQLYLNLHSAGRFLPVIPTPSRFVRQSLIERPTIDRGSITGKVYLDTNIPHPKGGSYIYSTDVSAAILASLAYNQPLTLASHPVIRSGVELGTVRTYVQVDNPTLARMQDAVAAEQALAAYFAAHLEPITEAAKLFTDAQKVASHRREISSRYHGLVHSVEEVRGNPDNQDPNSDPTIPLPAGIDNVIASIDGIIQAKLNAATDRIAPLSAGFPRELLTYAVENRTSA